jgi:hypothetical protein
VPNQRSPWQCAGKGWHAQGASNEDAAALLARVNDSGKAFLVDTELSGQRVLRFAVGGAQTQERHVRAAWKLLQEAATAVLGQPARA